jgi:hypothetical protein
MINNTLGPWAQAAPSAFDAGYACAEELLGTVPSL